MKVILAKHSGFCFGVRKALNEVEKLIKENKKVYILGNLIHNPQEIKKLQKKGVKTIKDINCIDNGTIVISAHGVDDKTLAALKNKDVVNTTCLLVDKVHKIAKDMEKKGRTIIIYGDKEHTEVKGIQGNLKNPIVTKNIRGLDLRMKYGVVSQTTQDVEKYSDFVNLLKDKWDIISVDTICSATKLRQKATVELAKEVDIMIVVGGKNSANTKRLAEISKKFVETKHIETDKELKKEWFNNASHVGVTAGASTPDWIINKVVEIIKNEFG